MAKANADRATAKPGDHRPAHATQPRVQTHDGRPTGGNPVQSDPPPLIHGNKTKRNELRAPTPPPVLGPPLSLYSPLPGGRSARADHEEEERERQGALALPCAPASPGLGSPRGPAFLANPSAVFSLWPIRPPDARGAPSGVSAFGLDGAARANAVCLTVALGLIPLGGGQLASRARCPCRYGVF